MSEETTINNAAGDEIKPCFKGRRKRERRCNAKGIDPTKTNTLAPDYGAIDFGESCRHGARYFNFHDVGEDACVKMARKSKSWEFLFVSSLNIFRYQPKKIIDTFIFEIKIPDENFLTPKLFHSR